jgi:hypothetical protein
MGSSPDERLPRFSEPLRLVDPCTESESRQGPTPGVLIRSLQMGTYRTMSRTCLVNLANSRSRSVWRGQRSVPSLRPLSRKMARTTFSTAFRRSGARPGANTKIDTLDVFYMHRAKPAGSIWAMARASLRSVLLGMTPIAALACVIQCRSPERADKIRKLVID